MGKAATKAKNKYNDENYERISLVVPKGEKDKIKEHAEANGESVNGFINRAINEAIKKDNGEDKCVFVVTNGIDGDIAVCDIFTDERQAELYVAINEMGAHARIEEYELDPFCYETDEKPKALWKKNFSFEYTRHNLYYEGMTMKEKREVVNKGAHYSAYITTDKDCGYDEAEEIILEFIEEWKHGAGK